jgi:Fe-S-cluster containining protein
MTTKDFDYLSFCKPCLSCCKNENIFLIDAEKIIFNTKKSENYNSDGCQNLSNDGKCLIHDNRPLECRIFPLDLKKINNKITWILWDYCPVTSINTISFYKNEIEKYEKILSLEWINDYIKHHETYEPKKYSNITFQILKVIDI